MYNASPFLQILAAIDDEQPGRSGGGGVQQQQQPRQGKVQLGDFWPKAPSAWFSATELKFEVANITGERDRFAHAVGAMGFNVLCAVMDL